MPSATTAGSSIAGAMRRILLPLLVPACFHPVFDHPACSPAGDCPGALICVRGVCETAVDGGAVDGAPLDAPSDAAVPDAPDEPADAQLCFGAGLVRTCLSQLPDHSVSLPTGFATLDTTSS